MKDRYWLIKRKTGYYAQDAGTGKRESLGATDKSEARRLLTAMNDALRNPALNLQLGKIYLAGHDPKLATRTWSDVMDELASHGKAQSQLRCKKELASRPFSLIRSRTLVETTSDDLRGVLRLGGAATNNYLRRLHNLALGLGWLAWPIIPPKLWEKCKAGPKRGVTVEEYERILASEPNRERNLYYQIVWETGAAQSDAAAFSIVNVDWETETFSYLRLKTGQRANLRIGKKLKALLLQLPNDGPFFPVISKKRDSDRAAEFSRRCKMLGLTGITLHSFRYAWAERALKCGYPERHALSALGHNSRAVHQAYAKKGLATCPALDDYENKVVPFQAGGATGAAQQNVL